MFFLCVQFCMVWICDYCFIYCCAFLSVTYDHRHWKPGYPVCSAKHKPVIGRLVVESVTSSESLLLYVFGTFVAQIYDNQKGFIYHTNVSPFHNTKNILILLSAEPIPAATSHRPNPGVPPRHPHSPSRNPQIESRSPPYTSSEYCPPLLAHSHALIHY